MSDDSLHILVFPWLAFGHMLPLLQLSKSLAKRGHRITYISTPTNIQRLVQIQPDLSPGIQFLSFPLPPVEHLPETAEATGDIPLEKVQYLKKAFDGLEAPFSTFFKSACADKSTRPDWVIMDFTHHWLPKIAEDCCVPCTYFSVFIAPALVFFGPCSELLSGYRTSVEDFTVPPNWIPFPSNVAFRLHEARSFLSVGEKNASGITDTERIVSVINGSKLVCVRSCHSLESKWLSLLSKLYAKEVMPVGLLPPSIEQSNRSTTDVGELDVMDWLDRQHIESVLYIAFGSEATLSLELLHELALGIEISKVHFLWALRKPDGLPEGFIERTKEFGVVMGWVPQMRVLAHASVGGFLTHCGWSSVVENFQFGHPLVQLPIYADQGLNARILEEKEIGVVIPRDEETGNFRREEVAKVVRFVMVEEEGKVIRHNAKQLKEIFTDRNSHEKHIDDFVEKLKTFK
ncbi:putative UDP-rhamnose:rhamnosyltransferase 1 [Carex littledalei]|uniref:Putative UDP-rhamnose:rhamnosyltransferase 1 n=1 Tax=Carex littledalei TaxID=544730 RepID=A0A833QST6_9POAL|nr:putative UDP-rhamnose:rhamnosyltransferase 1 [Carex littledalei]